MSKKEYIKNMLKNNIHVAKNTINELNEELKEINQLPNNCDGIYINGELCKNTNYKYEIMSSHIHIIGYMEGSKFVSETLLGIMELNNDDFNKMLDLEEKIDIENLNKIDDMFKKYNQ